MQLNFDLLETSVLNIQDVPLLPKYFFFIVLFSYLFVVLSFSSVLLGCAEDNKRHDDSDDAQTQYESNIEGNTDAGVKEFDSGVDNDSQTKDGSDAMDAENEVYDASKDVPVEDSNTERKSSDAVVDDDDDDSSIISSTAPDAVAGPDQNVSVLESVILDGDMSSDVDGDDLSYAWSIISTPEGSEAVIRSANSTKATIVPDIAGSYEIELIVNDGTNDSPGDVVVINAFLPLANAGLDFAVTPNTNLSLDGRLSYDPNGYPLEYTWEVVSKPVGATVVLSNSSDPATPVFQGDFEGTYEINLVVNNGYTNSLADTANIYIRTSVGNITGIYSNDFEDDLMNQRMHVTNGVWEIGAPTSGPGMAYLGSNVAATILDGRYIDHVTSCILTPPIQVPEILDGEAIIFSFWHWFNFYPGRAGTPAPCDNYSPEDHGELVIALEYPIDGWGDYDVISTYKGESGVYTQSSFSTELLTSDEVSTLSGGRIMIGFCIVNPSHTSSCTNGTRAGWYIDELSVRNITL